MGFIEQTVGGNKHEMRSKEEMAKFKGPDGGRIEEPSCDDFEDDEGCKGKDKITEDLAKPVTDGIDFFCKNDPFTLSHFVPLLLKIDGPPSNGGPGILLQTG